MIIASAQQRRYDKYFNVTFLFLVDVGKCLQLEQHKSVIRTAKTNRPLETFNLKGPSSRILIKQISGYTGFVHYFEVDPEKKTR